MTSVLHITVVIYGFVLRVFIYTLNSNSYFTVAHRLSDAWLLYRHCFSCSPQRFKAFRFFPTSVPLRLISWRNLNSDMCLKSANSHRKLNIALEKLSFDFAALAIKIGSCLKYFTISWSSLCMPDRFNGALFL